MTSEQSNTSGSTRPTAIKCCVQPAGNDCGMVCQLLMY
jgi:hypothetical protein